MGLRSADGSILFSRREGDRRFSKTDDDVALLLEVRRFDPSSWGGGEVLFETHGSWRLTREGQVLSFSCLSPPRGPAPYVVARVEPGWANGELLVDETWAPAGAIVDPLQFPLDEVLFTHLLARGRGILLHGCGVVVEGRGVLFVGHSGDGKTTTARLWDARSGAHVLSDDRIVVTPDGDGFRIHGTPWHGEGQWAEPESAPLAAVFVLEKAVDPGLGPLGPAEAVAALLARSFVPFHAASSLDWTLGFLEALAARVPCNVFRFRPDDSAPAFVEQWLGERM